MSTAANIQFYNKSLCVESDGDPPHVISEIISDLQESVEKYMKNGLSQEEAVNLVIENKVPAPPEPYQGVYRGWMDTRTGYTYRVNEDGVVIEHHDGDVIFSWDEVKSMDWQDWEEFDIDEYAEKQQSSKGWRKNKGWRGEPTRHALARKGIRTSHKKRY